MINLFAVGSPGSSPCLVVDSGAPNPLRSVQDSGADGLIHHNLMVLWVQKPNSPMQMQSKNVNVMLSCRSVCMCVCVSSNHWEFPMQFSFLLGMANSFSFKLIRLKKRVSGCTVYSTINKTQRGKINLYNDFDFQPIQIHNF